MLNKAGLGLVVILLSILGISMTAGTIALSMRFLLNEKAVLSTQDKMKRIAVAISIVNISASKARNYESDVGALPTTLNDLLAKPASVSSCTMNATTQKLGGWCGPYWSETYSGEGTFNDGWERTLSYSPATRQLRSKGSNGTDENGGGDDLVQTF